MHQFYALTRAGEQRDRASRAPGRAHRHRFPHRPQPPHRGPGPRRGATWRSITSSRRPASHGPTRSCPYAAGPTVEDIDGNIFLDFTAGIAVSSTGYAHPRITAAIERQARDLIHFSASDFYLPVYAELAAKFDEIAPIEGPTRAFIGNSGTEAVEAAIKLARFATRGSTCGVPGRLPRPQLRRRVAHRVQGQVPRGFGPMLPGVTTCPSATPVSTSSRAACSSA